MGWPLAAGSESPTIISAQLIDKTADIYSEALGRFVEKARVIIDPLRGRGGFAERVSAIADELMRELPSSELDVGCWRLDHRTFEQVEVEAARDGRVASCEAISYLADHAEEYPHLIGRVSENFPMPLAALVADEGIGDFVSLKEDIDAIRSLEGEGEQLAYGIYRAIFSDGAFSPIRVPTMELSALGVYRERLGDCTEAAKLLFAAYRFAGLEPFFAHVNEDLFGSKIKHVCVGLDLPDGRTILVDPIYGDVGFDAGHSYARLTMRQFWGRNENYVGASLHERGETEKALDHYATGAAIYSGSPSIQFNAGLSYYRDGYIVEAVNSFIKSSNLLPNGMASRIAASLIGILPLKSR